ncbi:alpha/beta fold hydrolase [Hoyosella subflava]|uniref:Alpha/beta hydrolase fold family hydrolase n=1 Tax=Hoyosella subflava (strain DSM 45089 / JCM 17490 / NBRC 109087 / DQS3-9A1) TaxID=443218 RepID=F6EFS7_HOYSD|nr:alpha/beta fold hydrolase [Hoyosella subflava]AEF42191.1 Alpha/beta hydrolase fold family hydrolase [Hoyosella subflava DQS3-9A1]
MVNLSRELHVHRFGCSVPSADIRPRDPVLLALHGLTGHGQRWEDLARRHFPEFQVFAPDLRGHGRSPWEPPWTIEKHVDDLQQILGQLDRAVVVGHSFGGNLAIHLARAMPDRVAALVLLDPAAQLDPAWMLRLADATTASPDYTDREEARSDKVNGAWRDVDPDVLERELTEHLVVLPNGRVNWRISMPGVITTFSELARPAALPPRNTPTVLVVARRSSPPFVTAEFRAMLENHLGPALTVVEAETDHMVAQEDPGLVGAIVRDALINARDSASDRGVTGTEQ